MSIWRTTAVITHPSLGGNGTNTWHGRVDNISPDVLATLQGLTTGLEAFYGGTTAVTAGGTAVACDGMWVRVDDDSGDVEDTTGFNVVAGTSVAPLPPSQCLVVGWGTSAAGRDARGRTFVGPCGVNTLQDNGTPTEESRAALEAAAVALIDSFDGLDDSALGVWSVGARRKVPGPDVFRDFTRAKVANRFSVLRSRRD